MDTAIDGAYVEAVTQRVVEMIHANERTDISDRLVDAATLAGELGVERAWVYEPAHELHPIRLGNGPRARLRFTPHVVRAVLDGLARDLPQAALNGHRPTRASRARRPQAKSKAGRILAVRPRGAS